MSQPKRIEGARVCVIRYPDETTICANIAGFRSLGEWIAWLAESNPTEKFHFHLLWHLESEASRFDGARPTNVWFLSQANSSTADAASHAGSKRQDYELTFQVVSESDLNELASDQEGGTVPARFQKHGSDV